MFLLINLNKILWLIFISYTIKRIKQCKNLLRPDNTYIWYKIFFNFLEAENMIYMSFIETHRSVNLGTPIDITDDTSSTLVGISDTDTNDTDNSSVTSESQSIDINLRTSTNNVSNDCDSPSIEVHNTPMLNTTLDNH